MHRLQIAGTPSAVAEARHWLASILSSCPPLAAVSDDLTVCLSELVSNSIKHSRSANGGKIMICVEFKRPRHLPNRSFIEVRVTDEGATTKPRIPRKPPWRRDLLESSRGLFIVRKYSSRWGYTRNNGQTTTWFRFKYKAEKMRGNKNLFWMIACQ
ncbi:ATP-binding protein [Streptosporangium saharense]|uniref:ATP-binding protein n=1 Tax=Streptosporangium saharense TaxID=1706840 RepID=UPI0036880698